MMHSPVWTLVTVLVLASGPPADRPVSGVVGAKRVMQSFRNARYS